MTAPRRPSVRESYPTLARIEARAVDNDHTPATIQELTAILNELEALRELLGTN